jgi:hypothetical protein
MLSETVEKEYRFSTYFMNNQQRSMMCFSVLHTEPKTAVQAKHSPHMTRMLSVSVQWIRGPLAFGAGERRWKTMGDPEDPSVTVFQMQFPVISIDILKLHIEKSPKECLLQ